MGKGPDPYFRTVDAGTALWRDVYWWMSVRTQPGSVGGSGYKLSRAISFATSTWAEAMMAHLWGDPPATGELLMDPASGTDAAGNLKTTKYNDFANFRWLGALSGVRSEEHTSELQSQSNLVCRLLLEKKKKTFFRPPAYRLPSGPIATPSNLSLSIPAP